MLVQAAGHGLIRLSSSRKDAVVKPTTSSEARFYDCVDRDDVLAPVRRFLPRHYSTHVLQQPDPGHPTHTHEVEIENLCLLDRIPDRSSDDDFNTDMDATSSPSARIDYSATVLSSESDTPCSTILPSRSDNPFNHGAPAVMAPDGESQSPPIAGGEANASGPTTMLPHPRVEVKSPSMEYGKPPVTPPATRTQWSAPSVLDVKVGFIRHGPNTKPSKVEHVLHKDRGSTGPTLGLRICGLRHERRIVERDQVPIADTRGTSLARLATEDGIERADATPFLILTVSDDEDDQQHGTLRCYDTLQSRRKEPMDEANDGSSMPLSSRNRRRRSRRRRVPLGRRVEWVEGKQLGRTVDRDGFAEAIARFCTCIEVQKESANSHGDGERPVPTPQSLESDPRDYHSKGSFEARPHLPLVRFYRDEAANLLRVLDSTSVLRHYSFVSSSVIMVHDFHVKVIPFNAMAQQLSVSDTEDLSLSHDLPGGASADDQIRFRAQLRVVDFSSSGPLTSGEVFQDKEVGFREGVANLVALFDDVLARHTARSRHLGEPPLSTSPPTGEDAFQT
jgi:hypothetical protein